MSLEAGAVTDEALPVFAAPAPGEASLVAQDAASALQEGVGDMERTLRLSEPHREQGSQLACKEKPAVNVGDDRRYATVDLNPWSDEDDSDEAEVEEIEDDQEGSEVEEINLLLSF